MNTESVAVYVLPKMKAFLEGNAPWSQLDKLKNIKLIELNSNQRYSLSDDLAISPFIVPHRDEFSETAGYSIEIRYNKTLFIPDIDKWELWDENILELIKQHNYALLDATFYDGKELPGRDISKVPHPFVSESIKLFQSLTVDDKRKIYFIHLNHTNPLLNNQSEEFKVVASEMINVASEGLILSVE